MNVRPDQMLAHYRLIEKIGEGGMGVVWKALDTKLDREVAVKVLPAEVADDPERLARFEREARVVAALNHSNIVTLHSVEHAAGLHFITMELVRGTPLSSMIPRGGLPLDRLLKVAVPLSSAVAAAHEKEITHRDLKPANVMVGEDGLVKVLDFGLAKTGTRSSSTSTQMPTATVTSEGKILGTAAYMSPEQAEGKPLDCRTDVFSLGIVLYEIATGQRPFTGETHASVVSSILRDDPPSVVDVKPGLPRQLARVLRRCLNKDPKRRYSSAVELYNELLELKEELETGELTPTASRNARRHRLTPWLLLPAVAAVALAVWIGLQLRNQGAAGTTIAPNMRLEQLTSDGASWDVAISPDGQYMARVVRRRVTGARSSIRLRQLETGSETEILDPRSAIVDNLVFAPDGNYIYYTEYRRGRNAIFRLPLLGGTPRQIVNDTGGKIGGASCSPEGDRVAFVRYRERDEELVLAAIDGSGERILTSRPGRDSINGPAWSPDAKTILFVTGSNAPGRLIAVNVSDGSESVFVDGGVNDQPAWMPDGGAVLAMLDGEAGLRTRQIWLFPFPAGPPRRITQDASFYDHITVSRDGRALMATRHEWWFSVWTSSRSNPGTQTAALAERLYSPRTVVELDWLSQDRVVLSFHGERGPSLSVLDLGSGTLDAITTPGRAFHRPVALPNSGRLLVHEGTHRSADLWALDPETADLTPVASSVNSCCTYAPAGERGVFYLDAEGIIRFRNLENDTTRQVWDTPVVVFSVSDDADRLYLVTNDAGKRRIEIVSLVDGSASDVSDTVRGWPSVRFVPASDAVTYVSSESGSPNLWIRELPEEVPTQLTTFDRGEIFSYSWAPDGQHVAIVLRGVREEAMLIRDFDPR